LTSVSGFYSVHEHIQGLRQHFARSPGRPGGVNQDFHDRKQGPDGQAGIDRPEYAFQNTLFELGLLAVTTAGIAVAAALAPTQVSYKASVDGSSFAATTR
jgi:hypothetical protein